MKVSRRIQFHVGGCGGMAVGGSCAASLAPVGVQPVQHLAEGLAEVAVRLAGTANKWRNRHPFRQPSNRSKAAPTLARLQRTANRHSATPQK